MKVIVTAFCLIVFIQLANAQQTQSDSLIKANEQLKLQNDSLKNVQKQNKNQTQSNANSGKPKDARPLYRRFTFDISTSFWVNTSSSYFEFTPMLTYHFPKMLGIGAGPTYLYRRDRINDVSLNGWGGKVFAKANLTKWLYAWTEYQGLKDEYVSSVDAISKSVQKDTRYVDSWFLSLGMNIRLGKRHAINAQALYDVLYKESTSPYYSPWIYRIGFGF